MLVIISSVFGVLLPLFVTRYAVRWGVRVRRALLRMLAEEHCKNSSQIKGQYVIFLSSSFLILLLFLGMIEVIIHHHLCLGSTKLI